MTPFQKTLLVIYKKHVGEGFLFIKTQGIQELLDDGFLEVIIKADMLMTVRLTPAGELLASTLE